MDGTCVFELDGGGWISQKENEKERALLAHFLAILAISNRCREEVLISQWTIPSAYTKTNKQHASPALLVSDSLTFVKMKTGAPLG